MDCGHPHLTFGEEKLNRGTPAREVSLKRKAVGEGKKKKSNNKRGGGRV